MAGAPHLRPVSTRKPRKLSKEQSAAWFAWKTDGRIPYCDPHHCIDAQVLRHMGFADREWDPRNKLWVPRQIHAGHTTRMHPLPWSSLNKQVLEFAADLDMELGRSYFLHWLIKHYPIGEVSEGATEGGAVLCEHGIGSDTQITEAESLGKGSTSRRIVVGAPSLTSSDEGLEAA